MPKSEYERFQERYEDDADAEFRAYAAMPLHALLDRVRAGDFGGHFQLWPAIAEKKSLAEAAWPLFDVLLSKADYLTRYHCANALIALAGKSLSEWKAVTLSSGPAVPANLEKVRVALEAILGLRTG